MSIDIGARQTTMLRAKCAPVLALAQAVSSGLERANEPF
jgi:hypothetical protein